MIDRFKIFKKKEEPIIDEIKVVDTGNKRAEDFDTVVCDSFRPCLDFICSIKGGKKEWLKRTRLTSDNRKSFTQLFGKCNFTFRSEFFYKCWVLVSLLSNLSQNCITFVPSH